MSKNTKKSAKFKKPAKTIINRVFRTGFPTFKARLAFI